MQNFGRWGLRLQIPNGMRRMGTSPPDPEIDPPMRIPGYALGPAFVESRIAKVHMSTDLDEMLFNLFCSMADLFCFIVLGRRAWLRLT